MKILEEDKAEIVQCIKTKGLNKYYVYLHFRADNRDLFYIGKGCKYRYSHISTRNKHWKDIFNKAGAFTKIYSKGLSFEEAGLIEQQLIMTIGLDNLCNVTLGGYGGLPEHLCKSKSLYNKTNPNFGNKYASNPLSIPIVCLNPQGQFVKEYSSAMETKLDGFSNQTVTACCKGKRPHHRNFIFLYKSDYNINENYSINRVTTMKRRTQCFDLQGNFIKEYESTQATVQDGFKPKNVQQVCLGQKKSHQSKIFKYV